jgi:hypothetical protein
MSTDPATPDPVAARLAEIREREQAATAGPWWFDEDELMWRLHGVHAVIPEQMDGLIPEQVMNHQILKAPKSGTRYAEYWPGAADAAFITNARTDVPALLAALETALAALSRHQQTITDSKGTICAGCLYPVPCPDKARVSTALLGETGQSLGEQPHPAAHCHLGGKPHLGPCTDPEAGTDG